MGARANYAILENGKVSLFYSHWGAASICEDIFHGPANTEEFIRANPSESEGWLDDIWAEGGVALNKDNRQMTYYGGQWPYHEDDLESVYGQMLAENWRGFGWSVQRASEWQDIARAVGVDPASVTAERTPSRSIDLSELGTNLLEKRCSGLLSVRQPDGSWDHRGIDFMLSRVLLNGPAIVGGLRSVATLEEVLAADVSGSSMGSFAAADPERMTMRMELRSWEFDEVEFVRNAWPGWTIESATGGIVEHFRYTGDRDAPAQLIPPPEEPEPVPEPRTDEECRKLILEHIAGRGQAKNELHEWTKDLIQKLAEQEGAVGVTAPHYFTRVPEVQPSFLDRLRAACGRLRPW